jgi:uncharacterized protein YjbI with pentapeptide repeats
VKQPIDRLQEGKGLRMLLRQQTRGLVIIAIIGVTVLLVVIALTELIRSPNFGPQTAALVTASATLAGVLVTQVVNTYLAGRARTHAQDLADQRAQAEALQQYFEKMTELVREHKLRTRPQRYDEVRILARAQTLTVLRGLDPTRKRVVLEFLRELRLINRNATVLRGLEPTRKQVATEFLRELRSVIMNKPDLGDVRVYPRVVGLRNADLSNARLRGIQLISTDRKEVVSLEGAILRGADLRCADLEGADMRGADLRSADLKGACMRGVDLDDSGETKRPAELRGAELTGANLTGANLRDARYNSETSWPENFDPSSSGAVRVPNKANTELLGKLPWP